MRYITKNNFFELLDLLKKKYDVYVPVKKGEQRFYKRYTFPTEDITIGEVRPFEPLKAFFTAAREVVAEDFKPDVPGSGNKPCAIIGVKACDLKGFKIQDHVFLDHDYRDPFYTKNREENLIITADCTSAIDTCFCLALGIKPYPEGNFDVNVFANKDGFVLETGSEKGDAFLKKYSHLFSDPTREALEKKEAVRRRIVKEVEKNITESCVPDQGLYNGIIERNYESDLWNDEAKTCVECGACNTICPTCHCFLLYDQKDKVKMERLRIWDSCMIKDFARVAGGANPRKKLYMRLRNRFEKKFDFFPKVADVYACTGCGRCISACPAKIDIRKILKRLVENA